MPGMGTRVMRAADGRPIESETFRRPFHLKNGEKQRGLARRRRRKPPHPLRSWEHAYHFGHLLDGWFVLGPEPVVIRRAPGKDRCTDGRQTGKDRGPMA